MPMLIYCWLETTLFNTFIHIRGFRDVSIQLSLLGIIRSLLRSSYCYPPLIAAMSLFRY